MQESTSFANNFIIAMPGLSDPGFARTVSLIWEHNERGALGLVINRPSEMRVGELFEQLDIKAPASAMATEQVMHGGPVSVDRGFVLHEQAGPWESTLSISPTLQITTSRDILEAISAGDGPQRALLAVGYAGWMAGQLEEEITANSWLSANYTAGVVFDTPAPDRWEAAARILGIDPQQICLEAGHA